MPDNCFEDINNSELGARVNLWVKRLRGLKLSKRWLVYRNCVRNINRAMSEEQCDGKSRYFFNPYDH